MARIDDVVGYVKAMLGVIKNLCLTLLADVNG